MTTRGSSLCPPHITSEAAVESISHAAGVDEFHILRRDAEHFVRSCDLRISKRNTTAVRWLKEAIRFTHQGKKTTDSAFHRVFELLQKRLDAVEMVIQSHRDLELESQKKYRHLANILKRDVLCCLEFNRSESEKEKLLINETTEILAQLNAQSKNLMQTMQYWQEVSDIKSKKFSASSEYVPYHMRHLLEVKATEEHQAHESIEIPGPPCDELVLNLRLNELKRAKQLCDAFILASIARRESFETNLTNLSSSLRSLDGLLKRLHKPMRLLDKQKSIFIFDVQDSNKLANEAMGDKLKQEEDEEADEEEDDEEELPKTDHSSCRGCAALHVRVDDCSIYLCSSVFKVQLSTQMLKDIVALRSAVKESGHKIDERNEWSELSDW